MRNLRLLTLISFLLFMSRGIIGPVTSLYSASLGADYVAIGLLGTVTSLTAVVASALWGSLSDRLGRRKQILVGGLLLLAAAEVLIATAPSFHYLFAWNVLSALASAAYGTASLALMGDLLERGDESRGLQVGTYRGLASLGFGLMALISGRVADMLQISAPFWIAASLALAAGLVSLTVQEPGAERAALPALGEVLREAPLALGRRLRALLAAARGLPREERFMAEGTPTTALPLAPLLVSSLLWSLVTGAVYAVWANYMVLEAGYSPTVMSRLWAVASLSEFPLMILAGWLSDRIGRLPMLSLGFVAWSLVFTGYILVPRLPWIIGVQLVRGFAYSAFTATAMAYAAEVRSRDQRGRVSGLYSSAGGLGSILGAAVGGTLTQALGFRAMFAVNAAVILAGALYLAWAALRHRQALQRSAAA
ncbi:MAG: MFS transporter [Anaerolineae bacterium]|jgi:SET family sugar efflux transporter-like MFS transporter|nr:MFS transporter [Chloroflexota bacterium]